MHLEGGFTTSRFSSSASVHSVSGEMIHLVDFSIFSGTFLSDKPLSLMNLSSKNFASHASMMELMLRSINLQISLSLAKPRNTHRLP